MLDEIDAGGMGRGIEDVAKPIGRTSTPEEQANVLLFLASRQASYVNGAILPVEGGYLARKILGD